MAGGPDLLTGTEVERGRARLGSFDGHQLFAEYLRPILILGPHRSHRTRNVVVPMLSAWDGPAVVTCADIEVIERSIEGREQCGAVSIVEPSRRSVGGRRTVGWSPLADCTTYDNAQQTATWITDLWGVRQGLQESDFWYGLAAQLLAPLLYAAQSNGYNMRDVVRWVKTEEEFEVRSLLQATGNDDAMETFEASVSREERSRSSVYTTLFKALESYNYSDNMEYATGEQIDIDALFDGRSNTIYLLLTPSLQRHFSPQLGALVRRIILDTYDRDARGERIEVPVLLLLDDFAAVAPLNDLSDLASTAPSLGVQLVSVFSDYSQAVTLFGESKARTMVNNHAVINFMAGSFDPATLDLADSLVRRELENEPKSLNSINLRTLGPATALCLHHALDPFVVNL